jgi:hypothetical protein
VALLEQRSLAEIAEFFESHQLRVIVHTDAWVPSADERRRLPSSLRRELRKDRPTHWAALTKPDGELVARWYGSGMGEEAAIRSAARRWRVEQIGSEAESDDHLP